jgi:hypothetical protein
VDLEKRLGRVFNLGILKRGKRGFTRKKGDKVIKLVIVQGKVQLDTCKGER